MIQIEIKIIIFQCLNGLIIILVLLSVLDSNSELESSIVIRTAASPVAGECHANPTSGIAGQTLFSITCSQFRDVYGDNALSYYFYERYEHDQNELGSNKYVKCIFII